MNESVRKPPAPSDAWPRPGRGRCAAIATRLTCSLLSLAALSCHAEPGPGYGDVAPIIAERCLLCHSGASAAAGLALDSYDGILKGSAKGAVVQPGQPAASELIRRLRGTSQPRMPMTGPPYLSEPEIALFEAWVAGGLVRGAAVAAAPAGVEPGQRPAPGEAVTYRHVAPIFARRCAKCHTDDGQMGPAPEGYRLTSYAATLSRDDRVRVVPGNPGASALVRHVRGQARPRMPFDGPPYLDDADIRLIEDWIAQGARSSDGTPAPLPVGAKVRLHGHLTGRYQLDGLELMVDRGTRIDKKPRPGDYVQVRGRIDSAGNVEVERLRRR